MNFSNETINLSELPEFEAAALSKPHPNYWKVISINLLCFMLFLALSIFLILYINEWINLKVIILTSSVFTGLGLFLFYLYRMAFKRRGYALRSQDIQYKSGLIAEKTTIVPINRIQHVALNEGLFSRMYGLASLQIYTASGNEGDIQIKGIELESAQRMKTHLINQIAEQTNNN